MVEVSDSGGDKLGVNRMSGKSMLKNKSPQIARMSMSSYVGYLRDERIISSVIVERDSKQNQKAGNNNMINVCTLHFEHPSKKGVKAGSCTSVRTMTRMGCNLYTNWLSDIQSCVF